MVSCPDDAAQHEAQNDEQSTLRDNTGDLMGQVKDCGKERGSGRSGPIREYNVKKKIWRQGPPEEWGVRGPGPPPSKDPHEIRVVTSFLQA